MDEKSQSLNRFSLTLLK